MIDRLYFRFRRFIHLILWTFSFRWKTPHQAYDFTYSHGCAANQHYVCACTCGRVWGPKPVWFDIR